jgi:hypothetical protein
MTDLHGKKPRVEFTGNNFGRETKEHFNHKTPKPNSILF